MFIVAVAELKVEIQDAIRPLAGDLATTPYELKLAFNAGFPAVVLVTADETQARAAQKVIAGRGHRPILCDRRDVTPSSEMTQLRAFRLLPDALIPDEGSPRRLDFGDISVLLRATHRTTSERTEQVKERKIRPVMAVMTGGLVLSKTTQRTVTSSTAHNEQVLYLFSRSHAPWLLRERNASYSGLGSRLSASSFENFGTTIQLLREGCPSAAYDERLKTSRPMRGVADGIDATDIYAHMLAMCLAP